MNRWVVTLILAVSIVACIHPGTSAQRYEADGNFSLAMEYQSLAYEMDGREDSAALVRGVELARVGFEERLARCERDKAYEQGHSIVVEWMEFERWIARLRISDLPMRELTERLETWRQRASRDLIGMVDVATEEGRYPRTPKIAPSRLSTGTK